MSIKRIITKEEFNNENKKVAVITKTENLILSYICQALTSIEIGDKIGISSKTVEVHRHNLLVKTGCHSTLQLAIRVLKQNKNKHLFDPLPWVIFTRTSGKPLYYMGYYGLPNVLHNSGDPATTSKPKDAALFISERAANTVLIKMVQKGSSFQWKTKELDITVKNDQKILTI